MKIFKKIIREIKKIIIYAIIFLAFYLLMKINYSFKEGNIFNNIKNYALSIDKQSNPNNGSSYMLARELKQVGNLICYKGKYTYIYFDEENKWYGSKNISASLIYNFGLGIDFSTINIEVKNEIVVVKIPIEQIKVSYVELENKESTLKYFNSIFMEKYDINEIQRACREAVENEIANEKVYFEEALLSIKERITKIAGEFGYNKIEFK